MDLNWVIKPEDIEWELKWNDLKLDGTRKYPDKPEKEMVFEDTQALAHLLINNVIFLNSHHWEKTWPDEAKKSTALLVNCNDIFEWATGDAEEVSIEEIETLYKMWRDEEKYKGWGSAIWCMIKRKEMPQAPVEEMMRKEGVDLDTLQKDNNIRENFGIGLNKALKKAGIDYKDKEFAELRSKFIKDNGWEGDAE